MEKYQCQKPSNTWCIYFEVNVPATRAYSGDGGNHYVEDLLKNIY